MKQTIKHTAICLACALATARGTYGAAGEYAENLDFSKTVSVTYSDGSATIVNNAGSGVSISKNGADITVESSVEGVEYILSGTSSSGSFNIGGVPACMLTLNGLMLSAAYSPAITAATTNGCYLVLNDDTRNILTDGLLYQEDIPGAIYSAGPLAISGDGELALNVQGPGHGIYSPTNIWIQGGDIYVSGTAKDALHVGGTFQMDNGTLKLAADSDGIDADRISINGGNIEITSRPDNVDGIKCDGDMAVNGGNLSLTIKGDRSKGIACGGNLEINKGVMALLISGNVYLKQETNLTSTAYIDPKYCTGISCDGNMTLNDGSIVMTHSGIAGKGISIDGNMIINDGAIDIAASGGASSTFTNEELSTDLASTDCVKVDGSLSILGGSIELFSTGNGGDGISAGGDMVFGTVGITNAPFIRSETTGQKVQVSSSDYANPKAASCEGSVTINGGTIVLTTANDGGEGLESKADITINGGHLTVSAYDDGIQAASDSLDSLITINDGTIFVTASGNGEGIESKGNMVINGGHIEITAGDDCINVTTGQNSGTLTVNGGTIYAYSSDNDGLDSNGNMYINGGFIIASGTSSPEESLDSNTGLYLNGGIVVGTAGSGFMCPVSSQNGYCSLLYSSTLSAGTIIQVQVNGTDSLVYEIPRNWSTAYLLYSSSDLTTGTSGTILTGGTVTGGTEFHGYYTGATVTGGTQATTFTISSTGLTTIGGSTGGGGTRPPRW
ncbi:MAG: carbohydrate-binding domain-containing protein [Pontiellaceae bacterium]|nr:carbohydrate-binding domain-containing protein [Pontiellaceae bacterium]MBN2784900.1 carbohydrate-binding domain-containing protein [Pontiellaceae bacterium]